MELFVKVVFWVSVLGVCCRALLMSISKYPRIQKFGPGSDVLSLLGNIAFAIWAAYVVWGVQ